MKNTSGKLRARFPAEFMNETRKISLEKNNRVFRVLLVAKLNRAPNAIVDCDCVTRRTMRIDSFNGRF